MTKEYATQIFSFSVYSQLQLFILVFKKKKIYKGFYFYFYVDQHYPSNLRVNLEEIWTADIWPGLFLLSCYCPILKHFIIISTLSFSFVKFLESDIYTWLPGGGRVWCDDKQGCIRRWLKKMLNFQFLSDRSTLYSIFLLQTSNDKNFKWLHWNL